MYPNYRVTIFRIGFNSHFNNNICIHPKFQPKIEIHFSQCGNVTEQICNCVKHVSSYHSRYDPCTFQYHYNLNSLDRFLIKLAAYCFICMLLHYHFGCVSENQCRFEFKIFLSFKCSQFHTVVEESIMSTKQQFDAIEREKEMYKFWLVFALQTENSPINSNSWVYFGYEAAFGCTQAILFTRFFMIESLFDNHVSHVWTHLLLILNLFVCLNFICIFKSTIF